MKGFRHTPRNVDISVWAHRILAVLALAAFAWVTGSSWLGLPRTSLLQPQTHEHLHPTCSLCLSHRCHCASGSGGASLCCQVLVWASHIHRCGGALLCVDTVHPLWLLHRVCQQVPYSSVRNTHWPRSLARSLFALSAHLTAPSCACYARQLLL